jgi:hypothetical protein
MKPPTLVWHCTTGRNFIEIVADGAIKPAKLLIGPSERPVVWFSRNPLWEPTANKLWLASDGSLVPLDMEQTYRLCGGLVRIGVTEDVAPYNFRQLQKVARISSKMAARLRDAGIKVGANPSDWYASLEPVPREKWSAVEVWNGSHWEHVPTDEVTLSVGSKHDKQEYASADLSATWQAGGTNVVGV